MSRFVEHLRNQAKWYAQPGHNARDLMDSRLLEKAADEIERLAAQLEAAEKDIALKERVIDSLGSELNAVANERDALRAKVAAMEKQEPECEVVGQVHNVLYEVRTLKYDLPAGTKLYALPGAKGEEK